MRDNNVVSVVNGGDCSITNTALIACLVANDLKHIHLHTCGRQFDRIHNITQEYYDTISEETDYLCELAIELGETLPNLTQAGSIMSEYSIQSDNEYEYDNAITQISEILSTYINWLYSARECADARTDIQSYLDDKIRYWSKELDYKMARRSSCNGSVDKTCDANCELDDYIDTSNIVDVTETTQTGSIGQHKNTNTTSFPKVNRNKKNKNINK